MFYIQQVLVTLNIKTQNLYRDEFCIIWHDQVMLYTIRRIYIKSIKTIKPLAKSLQCTNALFGYVQGLLMIDFTSVIKKLHPRPCGNEESVCSGPSTGQMAFFLTGWGLLIAGAAGIRPCNLAFGADQFNPNTESGKKGINSFFNWYFFTYTFAQMVSLTLIVYVQSNVSWSIGLAIPAALMLIACLLFFMGTKIYVKVKPQGSPLLSFVQVIVAAVRKSELKQPDFQLGSVLKYLPTDSVNSNLPHTNQFR